MTGDKSCARFVGHLGQPRIRAHFCSLWRPLHSLYILKLIPTGRTLRRSRSFSSSSVRRLALSGIYKVSRFDHIRRGPLLYPGSCAYERFVFCQRNQLRNQSPALWILAPMAVFFLHACRRKMRIGYRTTEAQDFSQRVFLKQLVPLLKSDWSKRRSKHAY